MDAALGPGQDHRRRPRAAARAGLQHLSGPDIGAAPLGALLDAVAAGHPPPADGSIRVLPPVSSGEAAVLGFVAAHVVVADGISGDDVRALPRAEDLSGPFTPPFLTALCELLGGRRVNAIDAVLVADPLPGPPPLDLVVACDAAGHPRVARAEEHREDVRVWTTSDGAAMVLLGRGLGRRTETAFEVAPTARGRGLGRALARAARHLADGPVWAQVAPANVASVAVLLAAGFRPAGAEALLLR